MIKILRDSLIKKYFQFSGRASRKEYWVVYLLGVFLCQVTFLLSLYYSNLVINNLYLILFLVFVLTPPFIAVSVRRLHDFNFNGWFILLFYLIDFLIEYFITDTMMILIISFLINSVLGFIQGTPGLNKYGEPPAE
jgi:uncharacterized membrane protein YhaH (DUF805 family)